jgi:hypothetical protein
MLSTFKWISILSILTLALAGCAGAGAGGKDAANGADGAVDQPAAEAPVGNAGEEAAGGEESGEAAAEDTGAPVEDAEFVTAGEPKEIETTIEGMNEKVTVIPYTIQAYQISYNLRDRFELQSSDPKAQTAVYAAKMGEAEATIEVKVLRDTSMKDAVAAMQEELKSEGFNGEAAVEDVRDATAVPYKMANYSGDGTFAGFKVFGLGEHSLVIKHKYPAEAGDGMAAIMNEMLTSLTIGK